MDRDLICKKYYERLREVREEHCLSQQSVADILCVVQKTYSDYESGRIRLPLDSLIILAEYYNVSLDYLCGISKIKRPFPKE